MTSKEALDKIKYIDIDGRYPYPNFLKDDVKYKESIEVIEQRLNELENRDTPMQVQIKYSVHKYAYILERQQCPNCSKPIIYSQPNYCGHCGQRLNWRKQND